jgi:hypothetical protein
MASVITATNSSGLTTSADNSGVLQLASGTGNLVTIPSVTGTAMVSGNQPAFSAYLGSNQSATNVWQKVQINTEEYDTASCFDTTNYRFTPNVAGYYQINASQIQSSSTNRMLLGLYKNGTIFKYGTDYTTGSTIGVLSTTVYANGSTDFFEFWIFSGGSVTLNGGNPNSFFQACLVRAA